jgi:periplasmic protein CpxP/Spy
MKKENILWYCIALLTILNLACLAFIISRDIKHPPHRFDSVLIETLNLDKSQIKEFNRLKHEHHMQMDQIDGQMQSTYNRYFSLLNRNDGRQKKDSLEQELAALYRHKAEITYRHFDEIKAICSPQQQQNFGKLVPLLMQVITPPKKPEPNRGK